MLLLLLLEAFVLGLPAAGALPEEALFMEGLLRLKRGKRKPCRDDLVDVGGSSCVAFTTMADFSIVAEEVLAVVMLRILLSCCCANIQ